jgi:DNA-binding SARP family transcriptional activator
MKQLSICLFGDLHVSLGNQVLTPFATQNANWLFAYLVLHRDRPTHRDVLCGRLWGERTDSEARRTLRTALWRLRNALATAHGSRGEFVRSEGRQLQFVGDAWVDVEQFEACLREPTDHLRLPGRGRTAALVRAAALYRADLLEGVYEEWCLADRERLRLAFLTTLERLVEYHTACSEWLEAITWGARLLHHDPVRENVHRRLMTCHIAHGDRPSALRQYEQCRRVLRDELGIEPMAETRRLHQRIREGVGPSVIDSHTATNLPRKVTVVRQGP